MNSAAGGYVNLTWESLDSIYAKNMIFDNPTHGVQTGIKSRKELGINDF